MEPIIPKSLPVTNKKVIEILSKHKPWGGRILDLGAGEGYFSSLLAEELAGLGCSPLNEYISACDLFPGHYKFEAVKCDFCDFNTSLPYGDNSFNAVCSIEVIEHLENIFHYSREVFRILKAGGVAVITTPNVLNINSRLSFFATGFPLLYEPLPISSDDPRDLGGHINPVSYYYLSYALKKAGFREIKIHTDRLKTSAKFLSAVSYLPIKLIEKIIFRKFRKTLRNIYQENYAILSGINSAPLLLGRTVIIEAVK